MYLFRKCLSDSSAVMHAMLCCGDKWHLDIDIAWVHTPNVGFGMTDCSRENKTASNRGSRLEVLILECWLWRGLLPVISS